MIEFFKFCLFKIHAQYDFIAISLVI